MEDGALWGGCNPQQVGVFNGPDNQGGLLCHAESPFPQYWGSEAWTPSQADEIPDIPLMSSPLVDTSILPSFDPTVMNLPVTVDTVHEFAPTGSSRFSPQHGQWGSNFSSGLYPAQGMHDILHDPFLQFASTELAIPHLPQDYNSFTKSFGTIQPNGVVTGTNAPTTQYGPSSSMVSNNRVVSSINAPTTQYGNTSVVPNTMAMFAPAVPRGIFNTSSGMGGGGGRNSSSAGLMPLPKRHNTPSLASKSGGEVTASELGSGSGIATVLPVASSSFVVNQKSSASVMMPLADASHMHKMDSTSEEPKMASFNPGPYVNSARVVPTQKHQHDQQQDTMTSSRMWVESSLGKSSSMPIPTMGPRQQQAMSNSSPVTSLGFEHRHQQAMGNSSPVTTNINMGFEPRRQQAMSNSSPVTSFGPKPSPMGSSPIMGFEPRQQHQRNPSPSPVPIMGFEQRQQPATSTSPTLSGLSFEPRQPHQQPGSNPTTAVSKLVFEPMRQQPTTSNPRSVIPDSGESAPKWAALRMAGGLGGSTGLPVSEKVPMMVQQPETGTLKCALPRSNSNSPSVNANPINKRPLYPDDNRNQGGSMTKKPLNKWQGSGGCSRLEEISAAAHQKVTQTTGGRALGPALNTNLKPRARQGSANDPQSIAARVRRERISERLKVLQALIPNGDKVDMVTMLEKAINYVRCLELQIRMLKNDSLWPKALGPLPNTLQELLELAGPDFQDEKDAEEMAEKPAKTTPEVIEFDGHQPSADKE